MQIASAVAASDHLRLVDWEEVGEEVLLVPTNRPYCVQRSSHHLLAVAVAAVEQQRVGSPRSH